MEELLYDVIKGSFKELLEDDIKKALGDFKKIKKYKSFLREVIKKSIANQADKYILDEFMEISENLANEIEEIISDKIKKVFKN